jgi:thiol-disulfide isomerase/thioredoxin
MRRHLALTLGLLAGVALWATPVVRGGEKKGDSKPLLKVTDELTEDDAKDTVVKPSHRKVHKFKMVAGKAYRIDMVSDDLDAFLRLEDSKGKHLIHDDDSGGGWNARLYFKAPADGEYRIIATCYPGNKERPAKTGKYTLTVVEAKGNDLVIARAKSIDTEPAKDRKQVFADFKKLLEDKGENLTVSDFHLAGEVVSKLAVAAPAEAASACKTIAKLMSNSSDDRVAKSAPLFAKMGKQLAMVGKELDIKGPTLDGKELDWKSYRGKIVLVDFWATWCKPCMDELPNVQKMYKLYHDRGFEVVGISLDKNREALDNFMEKKKLPWKCIYDMKDGKFPLAERYEVDAIPLAILVDKEGRVISMNARGPELERLLEKHIGPPKKEKEDDKDK